MSETQNCFYFVRNSCYAKKVEGTPTPEDCNSCMFYKGPDRGLGDKIHKVVKATKLDKFVPKTKKPGGCGCGKRRAALNKKFPTRKTD